MEEKKNVMVFGAFDILHDGHIDFFLQAKKYGKLTIVVARDENIKNLKKIEPLNDEKKRLKEIKKLKIAEKVMLGSKNNFYSKIKKHKPDIICLGYDQNVPTKQFTEILHEFMPNIKIIRLEPYKENEFKSSILKNK